MRIFGFPRKKTLSADVIALLAQAHTIHRAELEFAKDEIRAELRDKVRKALEGMEFINNRAGSCTRSAAEVEDDYLITIGALFCENYDMEREWYDYVRDRRIARNDAAYSILSQQIARAKGQKG